MKEIPLSQGKYALIDDSDYKLVSKYKWHTHKTKRKHRVVYYARSNNKPMIYMHRLILNLLSNKLEGDHRDGNGLNNQRYNIRLATKSQNLASPLLVRPHTSKYRGVSWNRKNKKWTAQIGGKYSYKYLGYFHDEKKAAKAYDKEAIILYKDFSKLNFPQAEEAIYA